MSVGGKGGVVCLNRVQNGSTGDATAVTSSIAGANVIKRIGRLAPEQLAAKTEMSHGMAMQVGKAPHGSVVGVGRDVEKLKMIDVDVAGARSIDDLDARRDRHGSELAICEE